MHVHINALNAFIFLLMVIVTVGTVNVWCKMHPNNVFARAWTIVMD